jgi:uncharacterized protein YcfJ
MKTPISLALAVLAVVPVQAQIFRPQAVDGAVLGGIAGAIIGHSSGSLNHNGWQGAAIGATAGYLLGSVAEQNARNREAMAQLLTVQSAPAPAPAPAQTPQQVTIINNPPPQNPSPMASANGLFGR